jgi:hypothetical protein
VLYGAIPSGQPFAHFGGVVIEGAHAAAVGDVAALINNVKTLGPRGVGIVGRVAHVIDSEGQGKFESLCKIIRDHQALLQRFGLRVAHVVFFLQIRFHLPFIGGMRFANVDGQKIGVILIIVVNLNDVADLATKRRSSKAPKDQHQRPVIRAFADVETADTVQRDNARVWSVAAHFQRPAMHVR